MMHFRDCLGIVYCSLRSALSPGVFNVVNSEDQPPNHIQSEI